MRRGRGSAGPRPARPGPARRSAIRPRAARRRPARVGALARADAERPAREVGRPRPGLGLARQGPAADGLVLGVRRPRDDRDAAPPDRPRPLRPLRAQSGQPARMDRAERRNRRTPLDGGGVSAALGRARRRVERSLRRRRENVGLDARQPAAPAGRPRPGHRVDRAARRHAGEGRRAQGGDDAVRRGRGVDVLRHAVRQWIRRGARQLLPLRAHGQPRRHARRLGRRLPDQRLQDAPARSGRLDREEQLGAGLGDGRRLHPRFLPRRRLRDHGIRRDLRSRRRGRGLRRRARPRPGGPGLRRLGAQLRDPQRPRPPGLRLHRRKRRAARRRRRLVPPLPALRRDPGLHERDARRRNAGRGRRARLPAVDRAGARGIHHGPPRNARPARSRDRVLRRLPAGRDEPLQLRQQRQPGPLPPRPPGRQFVFRTL